MKSVGKCLKFELKYICKSTLIFLSFCFGIYIAIAALILYASSKGNTGSNVNTSFYIAGSIYIFAFISSSYKSLFNNLLMFGNTRKSFVLSSFIAYAALSVAVAVITIISAFLDNSFIAVSGNGGHDILAFLYPGRANFATEFLWFTAFFILVSSFSMFFGSMAYKFGKVFLIAFWVGFPLLLMLGAENTLRSLKTFFCLNSANGILLAPIYFISTAAILGICTWLAARRQPQNA